MWELQKDERPRERLIKVGPKGLANYELLAIILRTGSKNCDVLSLAKRILHNYPHLADLRYVKIEELKQIPGLGDAKASELLAVIEFGQRLMQPTNHQLLKFTKSSTIGPYLCQLIGHHLQEHVIVICLNSQNEVLQLEELFIGSLTESIVHPREIFNVAIRVAAAKIIIAHNHPSGNCRPSNADLQLTKRLIEAGQLLGIPVIDHFIVTKRNYYSISEHQNNG